MMNKKILPAMGFTAMIAISLGIANADCPKGYSILKFNKQSFPDEKKCEANAKDILMDEYEIHQYGLAPLAPKHRCAKNLGAWYGCYREDTEMTTTKASTCEGTLSQSSTKIETKEECEKISRKTTSKGLLKECVQIGNNWRGCYQIVPICKEEYISGIFLSTEFSSKQECDLKSQKDVKDFYGKNLTRTGCTMFRGKWSACYKIVK